MLECCSVRLRASICRHIVFNVHFCMEGVGAPFRVVFNPIDANSVWCNHSNTQPSQVIAPFEISLVPNVAALHGQVPNKLALMETASFFQHACSLHVEVRGPWFHQCIFHATVPIEEKTCDEKGPRVRQWRDSARKGIPSWSGFLKMAARRKYNNHSAISIDML